MAGLLRPVADQRRVGGSRRWTAGEVAVEVEGVALSATVPAVVLHEWRSVLVDRFPGVPHVVVEPGTRTGLPVLMDNPREVGADRTAMPWRWPREACRSLAVDVGLATTFDVVDGDGRYVGGVIAPGIETSLEVLGDRAAQLRQVELARPRKVIAKNTVEAMQSGLVFGFASQVEGLGLPHPGGARGRPGDHSRRRHGPPGPVGSRRVLVLHRARTLVDVFRACGCSSSRRSSTSPSVAIPNAWSRAIAVGINSCLCSCQAIRTPDNSSAISLSMIRLLT